MHGWMRQIQVINAIVLREMRTRFGRHRMGYLWALFEPVMYIATFAVFSVLLGRRMPHGFAVVPFLVTGFLPSLSFSHVATQGMHAINGNRGLLFYPDIRPLDLVISRTLLEIATYLLVFMLLMAGWALWEGRLEVHNVPLTLAGMLLAAGLGGSLGLVLCGLSVFSSSVERLAGPLMRPLFWISALFFSTNELPSEPRGVMLHNPVLHVVELTRSGWFPGYDVPEVSVWYPAVWILVLAYFGLTLERVARRRLELT
jgi:capsular polysaccharide transport system permease protein